MSLTLRLRRSLLPATALAAALLGSAPAVASHPAPMPMQVVSAMATPPGEASASVVQAAPVQAVEEIRAGTRGVNIAIVALGALWILLMIRRVQSVVALRHAEAGH